MDVSREVLIKGDDVNTEQQRDLLSRYVGVTEKRHGDDPALKLHWASRSAYARVALPNKSYYPTERVQRLKIEAQHKEKRWPKIGVIVDACDKEKERQRPRVAPLSASIDMVV